LGVGVHRKPRSLDATVGRNDPMPELRAKANDVEARGLREEAGSRSAQKSEEKILGPDLTLIEPERIVRGQLEQSDELLVAPWLRWRRRRMLGEDGVGIHLEELDDPSSVGVARIVRKQLARNLTRSARLRVL